MSVKRDNWPAKLEEAIARSDTLPFEYGKTDCVLFAADCVKAMTGYDFMAGVRGTYDTYEQAAKIIEYYGGLRKGLGEKLKVVNAFNCQKEMAGRGDVVMLQIHGKELAGIWMGHYALAPMPDEGLCRIPLAYVREVWGIV